MHSQYLAPLSPRLAGKWSNNPSVQSWIAKLYYHGRYCGPVEDVSIAVPQDVSIAAP